MNMKNKIVLILFATIILVQFQWTQAHAETKTTQNEEELPAVDPFAGGSGASSAKSSGGQKNPNNELMNDLKLVGTIVSKNKKIAIFSARDGSAINYKENQFITDTTMLLEIMHNLIIVQYGNNKKFEVYMNNSIKPSEG